METKPLFEMDEPKKEPPKGQASCLTCRKMKLKCVKADDESPICIRCRKTGAECITPDYRIGRRKGIKNKLKGIDKAIHQLENALSQKKQQKRTGSAPAAWEPTQDEESLRKLLNEAKSTLAAAPEGSSIFAETSAAGLARAGNFDPFDPHRGSVDSSSDTQPPDEEMHYSRSYVPPIFPSKVPGQVPTRPSPQFSDPETFRHDPRSLHEILNGSTGSSIARPASAMYAAVPHIPGTLAPAAASHASSQSTTLGASPTQTSQLPGADNPLGLLASVSEHAGKKGASPGSGKASGSSHPMMSPDKVAAQGGAFKFFAAHKFRLDYAEDVDPISIGLVTLEEASTLMDNFYSKLSHTRWGLDPRLHTLDFVRHRSSFLFTALIGASAKFMNGHEAISRRLQDHQTRLVKRIVMTGFKSVEIVLAFIVAIPWMSPGESVSEDPTSMYVALAMNMALDLDLDKVVVSDMIDHPGPGAITSRKALTIDGFGEVDPLCWLGRRLVRSRQRAWLCLFILDRGVALARGRLSMVPTSQLIKTCDNWYNNEDADDRDTTIVGAAVLRRQIDDVIQRVYTLSSDPSVDQKTGVDAIRDIVDGFFLDWHARWDSVIVKDANPFPPYLDILLHHTRLSIYGTVVNSVPSTLGISRHLCSSGLSAALNVMRAAVQGEHRLKSMPNNCAVMVSFAVCFVLGLLSEPSAIAPSLVPGAKVLARQTVDVLIRIGSTPKHRNGTSAVYGHHLKDALSASSLAAATNATLAPVAPSPSTAAPTPFPSGPATATPMGMEGLTPFGASASATVPTQSFSPFDDMLFSNMTHTQIENAVDLTDPMFDLGMFSSRGMEWMDLLSGVDWTSNPAGSLS